MDEENQASIQATEDATGGKLGSANSPNYHVRRLYLVDFIQKCSQAGNVIIILFQQVSYQLLKHLKYTSVCSSLHHPFGSSCRQDIASIPPLIMHPCMIL